MIVQTEPVRKRHVNDSANIIVLKLKIMIIIWLALLIKWCFLS